MTQSKQRNVVRIVLLYLLLVMPVNLYASSVTGTSLMANIQTVASSFWCETLSFFTVPLGFCQKEAELVVVPPSSEPDIQKPSVTEPDTTKTSPPVKVVPPPPATTTPSIVRESPTYVTNEYITNPTTIIREVVKETVRSNGGDSLNIDTSGFVTRDLFQRQVDVIFDSTGDSVRNLSKKLTEEVSTDSLAVSGDGTISGTLTVTEATVLSTLTTSGLASLEILSVGTTSSHEALTLEGVAYLASIVTPTNTLNRLYNQSGSLYWAGNILAGATVGTWDSNGTDVYRLSGNVGVGTTSPSQQLDITESMTLTNTTNANQFGIIYKGAVPFIHDFNYGDNGTVTTVGQNTFVGVNAGNLTMGSGATIAAHSSYNTFVGYEAGRSNTTGFANSALGYQSLRFNTTGSYNSAQGYFSLRSNTTGTFNSAQGVQSLQLNTTGGYNSAQGVQSLYANTTGSYNSAQGYFSLRSNTTGGYNSAQGVQSLYSNTTGHRNSAQGYDAGRFIADGATGNTTGSNSVFLGFDTRALADGQTNQIVIGSGAIGVGSNSVVLGNDSILKTVLKGNVGIGTTSPSSKLSVAGTVSFAGLTGNTGAGSLCLTANNEVVFNSGSDACLPSLRETKHDIRTLSVSALDMVSALDSVSFVYNLGDGRTRYGFIAEDVADIDEILATYDAKGAISGIDDRSMIAVVVKAMQEMWVKVKEYFVRTEQLEKEAVQLKQEVETLKMRLEALESGNADAQAEDEGTGTTDEGEGDEEEELSEENGVDDELVSDEGDLGTEEETDLDEVEVVADEEGEDMEDAVAEVETVEVTNEPVEEQTAEESATEELEPEEAEVDTNLSL